MHVNTRVLSVAHTSLAVDDGITMIVRARSIAYYGAQFNVDGVLSGSGRHSDW